MNPMWKAYTNKVLKTLNPEYEEDTAEEVTEPDNDMMTPMQEDSGPNAVSQLAKKMQGAGAKSWNRLSSLFNKEDEHQLLEETESQPVADHPLAVKPQEPPPRPPKRSAFWDTFATNFAAKKQAEAAAAAAAANQAAAAAAGQGGEGETEEGGEVTQDGQVPDGDQSDAGGGGGGRSNNTFSKYVSLGGGNQDSSFKWNFVTSKLADLKAKSN